MSKANKKASTGKAQTGSAGASDVLYTKVSTHEHEQGVVDEEDIHSRASDGGESSMSQGIPLKKQMAATAKVTSAAAAHMAVKKDFTASKGLSSREALDLLAEHGKNELEDKSVPKWLIFLQQLWAPMPIMIWIAAITEAGIQNWPDMGILLAIQFINASLGFYEIIKAGDAVAALKNQLKPEAYVKRDGKFIAMEASLVVPGDLVLLGAGSAVPADCVVNDGRIEVDQSAMTGESMAVTMYKGSTCFMGSTVNRGEVEATVTETGSRTFFGKTADMLKGGGELGNLQKVLLRIMTILVVLSFSLSGIVFGFLLASGADVTESISFTVVLIVASIPIAIEIVCTTTLALGSKELVKHGAIVTRLAAIEDMAGMSILCSDKTGTLTKNKMEIQTETPIYRQGETQYSILRYAAMAAKWHEPAKDALDKMTLEQADLDSLNVGANAVEQLDYLPFDPVVKRTEGTLRFKNSSNSGSGGGGGGGGTFKTTKGAPHVLLQLCTNAEVKAQCEKDVTALGSRGIRALAVAITNEQGAWEMLGLLTFLDPPREDTKETIHRAIANGVEVKMITGDHLLIAVETAKKLELGDRVPGRSTVLPLIRGAEGLPVLSENGEAPKNMAADFGDYIRHGHGFAQVFPEHKYLIVQTLRELGFRTGMTGDGVNDAPALKRADVGIAVKGATDAARAAADIVLTEEGLSTIVEGILIARCIFQRMKNFITYRIAATLQLLVFFFIAVLTLKPITFMPDDWQSVDNQEWPEFFRMPVLMLMLITLLNDGTLISIGYDNVIASKFPNVWNLRVVFAVSTVLALVALLSSLLILYLCLDSNRKGSLFDTWGIGGLQYGQITTVMYLKVSISDFLTLFSARTHDGFFWSSTPSPILLGAAAFALFLSTLLACIWPSGNVDNTAVLGLASQNPKAMALYVWLFCIFWWFIQDAAKVALYWYMEKFNVFGIKDSPTFHNPSRAVVMDDEDSLVNPLMGETVTRKNSKGTR